MNTFIRCSGTALLLVLLVFMERPAFAEVFLDLYAGPSYTEEAKVTISSREASVSSDIKFEDERTFGIRSGYWFKNKWIGVAGDLSTMHAKSRAVQFDLVPLTAMALFRLPLLADEEIPQGRLQPYAGIGPSVSLYTYASGDLGSPTDDISGWSMDVGYQIPAGVALQLSKRFAIFTEYRYANYLLSVEQSTLRILLSDDSVARDIRTRLQIHNVLLGVSFRF